MTTCTLDHNFDDNSFSLFPWILGIIILGILFISVGYTVSHGSLKHGNDALTVRECMTGNETLWVNTEKNYFARFCEIDDNEYGIQILRRLNGKWEEITSYIRRVGQNSMSIDEYLIESGYVNPAWAK